MSITKKKHNKMDYQLKDQLNFLQKEIIPKNNIFWCSDSPTNYARIKKLNKKTATLVSCFSEYGGNKIGKTGVEFRISIKRTAQLNS